MELTTVAQVLAAFYRLMDSDGADGQLTENDEDENEVAYQYLTRGFRLGQRYMLKMGYGGWRRRSAALSWSGSDAVNGGRYSSVPTDFLRAYGTNRCSALVEADGDRWGTEIRADEDFKKGDFYYLRGEQLWLAREAQPPATLYLDHHYQHPAWSVSLADGSIDFPLEARALGVAEAANLAKEEAWMPGGDEQARRIERALGMAQQAAADVARRSRQPRTFRKPTRYGNHW